MPVPPPRRKAVKTAPAKAAPAAKTPGKLRSAGGTVKYDFPMQQYLEKEPTSVHDNFVAWVKEQTGYDADIKTVQLAFVLRIPFQKSEQNQTDLEQRRAATEEAKAAKPVAAKGPAPRKGPVGRKKAAPVEDEEAEVADPTEEVEEVEEAPAPTRKRPATKAAKAPAKTPVKPNSAAPARPAKRGTPKAGRAAAAEEAF